MPGNDVFQPTEARGWQAGLSNLFSKETRDWWGTSNWWVNLLIWVAILNGILGMLLFAVPQEPGEAPVDPIKDGLVVFFIVACMAPPVGAVILAQDEILDEKQSGTAAWVLSKPVARPAFILAKLISNALGMLVVMVIAPGVIALLMLAIKGSLPPLLPFTAALGIVYLNALFYFCLALFLGAASDSRGAVIGLPLALLFGYQLFLGLAPWLAQVTPWGLSAQMGNGLPLVAQIAAGQPVASFLPVWATLGWCVLWVALALWKFNRQEF